MQIERRPIADLRLAAYNPRVDLQPGDPDYVAIERSIARWDLVEPLVWNRRSGNLVAGHQRLKVLRARGDVEVDVSVVDLSPPEEAALNVALNKIAGAWDSPKLFDVLSGLDGQVDLTMTGFEATVLADLARTMTTPLFTPDTGPTIATDEVTAGDVAAAVKAKADPFKAPERIVHDVTCPRCGASFGVE
jgi:hypothetical protein